MTAATLKLRFLKSLKCTLKYEKLAWEAGATLVAGVDEVGRGCLFGPVVAAAVMLDPNYRIRGLRDSKLLDRETREKLAPRIRENCLAWAVASVDVAIIDQINIYWASKRAMEEAVDSLPCKPDHFWWMRCAWAASATRRPSSMATPFRPQLLPRRSLPRLSAMP